MAVLGYLVKLKRGLGLAFGAHFLHGFSVKMFFTYFSISGQSFSVTPYFFPKISNKMLLSSYLVDNVINLKIFLGSTSQAMADSRKKRGRRKYKNLNILRTKRAF